MRDRLVVRRQSLRQQQRVVSGRMVTDSEMNGVYRRVVDEFNFASDLKRGDVLFPECTRTFQTADADTQAFLNRLHVTLENGFDLHYEV